MKALFLAALFGIPVAMVGCVSLLATTTDDGLVAGAEVVELYEPIGEEPTSGTWPVDEIVQCGSEDVESSDLRMRYAYQIPDESWASRVGEEEGRCGDDYETLIFRLANCERRARGIQELQCDQRLVWVGRAHSLDMIARDYFHHVDKNGRTSAGRLRARGMVFRRSGENLALAPNMALGHQGWMHSRGHRETILNEEFTHMGVGIVRSDRGYVFTALFSQD